MPLYIRKSVRAGPFRFNLSGSGIGVSAGIKGLRIGTGPRGHYIHAGRGGLYYRSSIPGRGGKARSSLLQPRRSSPQAHPVYAEPDVEMLRVSSADVLQMEDARFADILEDLARKQNSPSMTKILGMFGVVISIFAVIAAGVGGFLFGLAAMVAGLLAGWWLDSFRRTSVLMYDLEDETRAAYEAMTENFDAMLACVGKWHIDACGSVQDIHAWKRNAGARHILDRRPAVFDYSLPRAVKSNITPPAIKSGKETLYFFPDFMMVAESNNIGAVAYDNLSIRWEPTSFVEEGSVPGDTEILCHTWKHPNKNGGPDRRFANNRQIPVCRYESIHLSSSNGLNELLQVSRSGVTQPFAQAVGHLSQGNGSRTIATTLPALT